MRTEVKNLVEQLLPYIDAGDYTTFYSHLMKSYPSVLHKRAEVGEITELILQCGEDPVYSFVNIPDSYHYNIAVDDNELVLPEGIETVGVCSYLHNNINYLTLPQTCIVLEKYAFAENPIDELTIKNPTMLINYDSFCDCDLIRKVYYNGTRQQWFEQRYPKQLTLDITIVCNDGDLYYDADGRYGGTPI